MTFEDDKLGMEAFAERFETFVTVEHDFVEGSLVISIDAAFGSGKTTFLTMWKADLDERRKTDASLPKVISLNAWESDYRGDPLLAIVCSLVNVLEPSGSKNDSPQSTRLREAAKDVGWFVAGLANNLASHWIGVDPVSAGELAESKKESRRLKTPDMVAAYEERTRAIAELKLALREIFGGAQPKAFIFVDELDRCRPDFAITYLETIKHIFDIHGLVFVLAVDCKQLESSAQALFGAGLRFGDYFRKFSHRTVRLPKPSKEGIQKLTEQYVSTYLEREGKRVSKLRTDYDALRVHFDLIAGLAVTPRQAQEAFRILGHVAAGPPEMRRRMPACFGHAVTLMAILKVSSEAMYHGIGQGRTPDLEVGKFLIAIMERKKANYWFRMYIHGKIMPTQEGLNKIDELIKDLGFAASDGSTNVQQDSTLYREGWGLPDENYWELIYKKIEAIESFQ